MSIIPARLRLLVLLFATSVILSGCLGGVIAQSSGVNFVPDPKDRVAVSAQTKSEWDNHQKKMSYTAPLVYAQRNILGDYYFLRASFISSKFKGSVSPIIQLYISAPVRNWVFFNSAYAEGERLSLVEIDRRVVSCYGGTCALREDVAINITKKELKNLAQSGLEFQLSGRGGKREFSVPAEYFAGFSSAAQAFLLAGS